MLNLKTIRERLHEAPFTPFNIQLTDGRKILVEHPDFVALGGSVVFVTDLEDGVKRLDALHIVSLDDAQAKKRTSKN